MTIPTYTVALNGPVVWTFRVPRDQLDGFLHVLLFNDIKDFRVTREEHDWPNVDESAMQKKAIG